MLSASCGERRLSRPPGSRVPMVPAASKNNTAHITAGSTSSYKRCTLGYNIAVSDTQEVERVSRVEAGSLAIQTPTQLPYENTSAYCY